jgi:hypothetical protein
MRRTIIALLKKDQAVSELVEAIGRLSSDGARLEVAVDYRTTPYLDHTVVGWTDGPPGSNVVAVLSGADPAGGAWRRFTITRRDAIHYELDVFPTPFKNDADPLSPGIPPGASRPRA